MKLESMKTIFNMENYYRMVIDLFKEIITNHKINQVNTDKILEVQKILANALTTARIMGTPVDEITALKADIDFLKCNI